MERKKNTDFFTIDQENTGEHNSNILLLSTFHCTESNPAGYAASVCLRVPGNGHEIVAPGPATGQNRVYPAHRFGVSNTPFPGKPSSWRSTTGPVSMTKRPASGTTQSGARLGETPGVVRRDTVGAGKGENDPDRLGSSG